MMFTLAPPSNKTSSKMFVSTCIWITAIWLFISIVAMSTLECVLITMATLGFDIILVTILGFYSFSFFHIYIFKIGVIINN